MADGKQIDIENRDELNMEVLEEFYHCLNCGTLVNCVCGNNSARISVCVLNQAYTKMNEVFDNVQIKGHGHEDEVTEYSINLINQANTELSKILFDVQSRGCALVGLWTSKLELGHAVKIAIAGEIYKIEELLCRFIPTRNRFFINHFSKCLEEELNKAS